MRAVCISVFTFELASPPVTHFGIALQCISHEVYKLKTLRVSKVDSLCSFVCRVKREIESVCVRVCVRACVLQRERDRQSEPASVGCVL